MPATKPLIIRTALLAWRDAFRAIGAMPMVTGIAFAILILLSLVSVWIVPDPYALAKGHWLPAFILVSSIVSSLLLAPLAIVVHRYVLLGELTDRYPLDPFSARYLRFVGFALLLKILWSLPSITQSYAGAQDSPGIAGLVGFGGTVLFIAIVIVTVRRAVLFPAIAIDAPGASWSNARRDTKGSSWRVAFIFVLVGAPVVILFGPAYYFWMGPEFTRSSQLILSVLQSIFMVPTLCAVAAAASHIYRARADSLAHPAGYTVSSERSSAPRRRRYGWWIAGGVLAFLLAVPLGTAIYYAKPIKMIYDLAYGIMTGNPSFENCQTTVMREAAAGPLWYRLVRADCRDGEQSYWVYTKRSSAARYWLGLMTIGSPVPVSIRQTKDGHFEVILEAPLADGRASLPIDPDAGVTGIQIFDHGHPTDLQSPRWHSPEALSIQECGPCSTAIAGNDTNSSAREHR
jgi:hypothetical protein